MQTITLAGNGATIPALGIGTWAWGDTIYWGYGKEYGADTVRDTFKAALSAGVNLFDTAEIYGFGESERLLGQFMKEVHQSVFIATKYFPLPWRLGKGAVADALTASLKRLQVPSVELYQVHWPLEFFTGQDTLMEALADEVQQGRIKSVGVSNYSAEQMKRAHDSLAKRGVPLAVNQVQYSLLERTVETNGVMDAARSLGITILAYSPLSQGLLTGKYGVDGKTMPHGIRRFSPLFNKENLEKLAPKLGLLREIGETHQRTPAQVALNWLIGQGNVIPIPGAKTASQAEQNAGALGWSLTEDERAAIHTAFQP